MSNRHHSIYKGYIIRQSVHLSKQKQKNITGNKK